MHLQAANVRWQQTRGLQSATHYTLLARSVWCGKAAAATILIDACASQVESSCITRPRVPCQGQQEHSAGLCADIPIGSCVQSFAAPIQRQHASCLSGSCCCFSQYQVNTSSKCWMLGLFIQVQYAMMRSYQSGGASGVNANRRPFEAKAERQATGRNREGTSSCCTKGQHSSVNKDAAPFRWPHTPVQRTVMTHLRMDQWSAGVGRPARHIPFAGCQQTQLFRVLGRASK